MSWDISRLFMPTSSGIKGIANLFFSVGTIISVSPNTLTCNVLSNQGLLENVRLTFPQFSNGAGILVLPNVGDICAIGYTVQGTPYIVGYGAYDALTALKGFDRINLDYNSVVFTSNKRSLLTISDDIHLTTASGNHILLNNNPNDPALVLEASNRMTIRTGVSPDAFTINIIKSSTDKTTLSIKPGNDSDASLTFEFEKGGKVKMIISRELTIKVGGADGSNLVTAEQVKTAISNAIRGHSHGGVTTGTGVSGTGAFSTLPDVPKLELNGITNLKTESM